MTTLEAVFWGCVLALAYAWLGYPLALAALARPRRSAPAPAAWPVLSVIVAAHDEARHIAAKLASTLEQDYPADRLEVLVVSDGSNDATDAIVDAHPDPRVHLLRQEPRAGKALALNRGVAAAGRASEVLVFTDANAMFAPGALRRLAAPFADPRVGLVSGQGLYGPGAGDAGAASGAYVRLEAFVRAREGALGFLASADGAIYALRRSLYRDLRPADVNDLLHPIQVALAGACSRFEPAACTVEPASAGAGQELRRHVRIIAQGATLLRHWLPRLLAARRWGAAWMLLSHRVLRWTGGLLLAGALGANLALVGTRPLYAATLAAQGLAYAAALAGFVAERRGRSLGRLGVPYFFCVVAAAGVAGLARAVRGGADAVWAPAGQAPRAPVRS
jgi:hypothetical protein